MNVVGAHTVAQEQRQAPPGLGCLAESSDSHGSLAAGDGHRNRAVKKLIHSLANPVRFPAAFALGVRL